MNLSTQFNPCPKPSHTRYKPTRGKRTKFSTKVRNAIIKRDRGQCVKCHARYDNIHHIIFASAGGSGTEDNGVCVCFTCHEWAHNGRIGREWFVNYRNERLI